MPLHVLSTCAHRQEAKIVLNSLWYHHTYRWPSRAPVDRGLHRTANYRCDDTRCCIIQFCLLDDEHMVLETCRGMKFFFSYQKLAIREYITSSL